jgi:hypothetical protein
VKKLLVTLLALNRSFIVQIMTRNTESVSRLFSPPGNLSTFILVAIKTLAGVINLVFPVLERHHRLQVNNFRAGTGKHGRTEYDAAEKKYRRYDFFHKVGPL